MYSMQNKVGDKPEIKCHKIIKIWTEYIWILSTLDMIAFIIFFLFNKKNNQVTKEKKINILELEILMMIIFIENLMKKKLKNGYT